MKIMRESAKIEVLKNEKKSRENVEVQRWIVNKLWNFTKKTELISNGFKQNQSVEQEK